MELSYLFFTLLGTVSGITAGMFGIGGGMIIVPTMLFFGLSSHHAIALSVLQMIFASFSGSLINYKKNNLNLKDGIFVGFGGLIGASFSGIILNLLSDITLTTLFLFLSLIFFFKYAFNFKENIIQSQRTLLEKKIILTGTGILTGIFAISLGIGGGLLIAPILAYFLGYNSKKVVPLSLFFIIFSSISGTISFALSGVIDKKIVFNGILVGLSSIFGVFIGIKIMEKMKVSSHKQILLCVYALSILMTFISLLRKLEIIKI